MNPPQRTLRPTNRLPVRPGLRRGLLVVLATLLALLGMVLGC